MSRFILQESCATETIQQGKHVKYDEKLDQNLKFPSYRKNQMKDWCELLYTPQFTHLWEGID